MLPSSLHFRLNGTSIADVHRVASLAQRQKRGGTGVDVKPQTIERRVEKLETRVTRLEELPGRIDDLTGQILQLRAEMGVGFSAVRTEMRDMGDGIVGQLRGEIRASALNLKGELFEEIGKMHEHTMRQMIDGFDRVSERFDAVDARFDGVDARFDGVDTRFDGVDAQFDGVDARFD